MFEKLKSRKFWFAFLGALLPVAAQYFSEDVSGSQALQASALVIVSYIFGQGYVDAQQVKSIKQD